MTIASFGTRISTRSGAKLWAAVFAIRGGCDASFPKLHARYFAHRARQRQKARSIARFFEILGAAKLATALDALTTPELIGFDRSKRRRAWTRCERPFRN